MGADSADLGCVGLFLLSLDSHFFRVMNLDLYECR